MHQGSCHCGAVRITLPATPTVATACNCSLCRRIGGRWVYFEFGTVQVSGHPEATESYVWGDKTLRTVRCRHCGIVTHWEPLAPEPGAKHGVNLLNFDAALVAAVPVRRFDGADTWRFIDPPPPQHLIRPLAPGDSLDELTSLLHRAYARLGAMGLNYTAVDQTPEVTAQRIAGGHCLVAVDGAQATGRLIGTALVRPGDAGSPCEYFRRPGVASLRQFAVAPEHQGGGLGRALVAACEAWARAQGFAELALDTAEPAGHLRRFYARLGYADVGQVQWAGKVYRSVVMSKGLPRA